MRRRLNPSRKAVGLCLESLEDRTVPSTVAWSLGADGNFNDAAAWTDQSNGSHHIPTPGDDVVISGYVVTATANYAVDSINDNSPFQILGSFTITAQGEPSELNIPEIAVGGILYDAGAQVVTLDGSGDQSNPVLLGGTLDVGSGGVIRFNHGYFSVGPQFAFASTLDGTFETLGDAFGDAYLTMDYPVTAPAHFVQNDGTIAGTANFTIPSGATMTWNGGIMQDAGDTIIQSGGTMDINAGMFAAPYLNRTIDNSGTINYAQGGSMSAALGFGPDGVLNNLANANFNVQTAAQITGDAGLTSVFNNAGTITVSGPAGMATTLLDVPLNNTGQINIQSGGITVNGGGVLGAPIGTDSGSFTIAAGAGLSFANGMFTVNPGATFAGAGPVSIIGDGADLIVNTDVSIQDFVLANGTLDGTGTVTIATTGSWIDGTMQGSGTTVVASGVTWTISGTDINSRFLVQRTLSVAGTIDHTGGDINIGVGANNGVITIQPGATYDLTSDANFYGGGGTINNEGLFEKTSPTGTGTTIVSATFNNSGSVHIDSGTLLLQDAGTETGGFQVTSGLTFGNGTFNVNSGASFGGPGLVTVTETTNGVTDVILNVPATIANFDEAGGILDGAATLTLSSTASWTDGTMQGGGTTTVSPGATLTLGAGVRGLNSRTLNVGGTVNHTSGLLVFSGTGNIVNIAPTGTYNIDGDVKLYGSPGTINNQGLFSITSPDDGVTYIQFPYYYNPNNAINNSGTFQLNSGALILDAPETQTAGLTTVAAGATFYADEDLQLNGGVLDGSGTIDGNVTSTGTGAVSPGSPSPGILTVIGNVNLAGPLDITLAGTAVGSQYSQLNVDGNVALSGPINVTKSFSPAANTSFDVIDNTGTTAISGTFTSTGGAQITEGSQITAGGTTFLVSYRAGDGNDVYLTAAPAVAAAVAGVQVNDGSAQRSEVRSIAVTFSSSVNFAGGNAHASNAFQLTHLTDSNNVAVAAAVSTNGSGQTVVTLTFSGSETDSVSADNVGQPSLADGRYQLTILGADVTGTNGLELNNGSNYVSPTDTQGGGAGELGLYRLFGDVTGNGIVDQLDLAQFRAANNSSSGNSAYVAYLDADNSGTIDQIDLAQFRARNNSSVFPSTPGATHMLISAPTPNPGSLLAPVPVIAQEPLAVLASSPPSQELWEMGLSDPFGKEFS